MELGVKTCVFIGRKIRNCNLIPQEQIRPPEVPIKVKWKNALNLTISVEFFLNIRSIPDLRL